MTDDRVADGRRASTTSNAGMKAKKVRTPKSCDRCKSRKTKVSLNLILMGIKEPENSQISSVSIQVRSLASRSRLRLALP